MTFLDRSTWPDVEAARRDVLLLPVGSTEQHGPHLPFSTDTIIATRVAEAVHLSRPRSVLAPALPFGASGEHTSFSGTVSIGHEALTHLVVELVRDVSRWCRTVLVVNGHGGNLEALAAARECCRAEGRTLAITHTALPTMDAHAGRSETSLLLHLDPNLVRMDLAERGHLGPIEDLMPRLRRSGLRSVTPNGVLGDPTTATAAHGRELMKSLVSRALTAYDTLRTHLMSSS